MIEKNVDPDIITHTTLMKGYSKIGHTKRVFELFEDIEQRDLIPTEITFSTIIRACAITGDIVKAQSLLNDMKTIYSIAPNAVIYGRMLTVCARAKDLEAAKGIYKEVIASGVNVSTLMLSKLISIYAKCCNEDNSRQYFIECKELVKEMNKTGMKHDIYILNALIGLCVKGKLIIEEVNVLNEGKNSGLYPSIRSYNSVLNRISKDEKLSTEDMLSMSSKIINDMKKDGMLPDTYTYIAQMNLYFRKKELPKTVQLFNQLKQTGMKVPAAAYGIMMKCYEKLGDCSQKMEYLKPCLDLLTESEQNGIRLNKGFYTSILSACANVFDLNAAQTVWNRMSEERIEPNAIHHIAMMNVHRSIGDLEGIVHLFNEMKRRRMNITTKTYAFMIKCYEKLGDHSNRDAYLKPCLEILSECEQKDIRPDRRCYTTLLSACTKVSDFDLALDIWNKMQVKGIQPSVNTYTALINACLSVDRLDKAFEFLDTMVKSGIKPNEITYRIFMAHFYKKEDKLRAQEIMDRMETLGVLPDKLILKWLKELGIV
eukprot:g3934.t1